MALRWIFTCTLLWGLLSCGTVWGETVPCLRSRAECRRTGFSSISVIDDRYRCCAPGYTMSRNNGGCFCTKSSEAVQCGKGPEACQDAQSVSTDDEGNLVCCQHGFSLQLQSSSVNGQRTCSCTCTRPLQGGKGSGIPGEKVTVSIDSNNSTSVNITNVAENAQHGYRKFRNSLRKKLQGLDKQMENMIELTKSMTQKMKRMKNRLESIFSQLFRS